jgi:transcriptional regulator with PAS, ATPase and Fis domain
MLQEVRQARTDREARTAVWPADTGSLVFGDTVVTGQMMDIMAFAKRVAQTNVLVLITGESGTGKEIVARAVHSFSNRADDPFVPFNCAAIPPHLLESQLFGYRRGAFTGAEADYIGIIRSAQHGTLFLDEIGELSLELQPKFLRFLESGEISPLGQTESLIVDVRIVAATNRSLEQGVREGRFREDLFYRINVVRLALKPLRERRDEIPMLVEQFVARAAKDFNKGHIDIAEETMERLLLYRWPGNVRQLSNEIRRMVALVEPDSVLQPYMISDEIVAALPVVRSASGVDDITVPLHAKLTPTIERIEREMIKAALQEHQGKVDEAAKALGISRKGLYLKRHRFGL